eukprot:scaffold404032_cov32-Prasinocladus_malaysianus.AAC.1
MAGNREKNGFSPVRLDGRLRPDGMRPGGPQPPAHACVIDKTTIKDDRLPKLCKLAFAPLERKEKSERHVYKATIGYSIR